MQASSLTGKCASKLTIPSEKPFSSLKVGQESMERTYYEHATHEQPDGTKCLSNFSRFGTDYSNRISINTKPGDFKVPVKNANTLRKIT